MARRSPKDLAASIAAVVDKTPAAPAAVPVRPAAPARDATALAKEETPKPAEKPAAPQEPPKADGEEPKPAAPKKLEGSKAVEGGGADEESADDEKARRRRREEHEWRLQEIEQQHRHEIEMMQLREREAIRRENREEARAFAAPLIGVSTHVKYDRDGKSFTTSSHGWRTPSPYAGMGVYFDPGGGPSSGGSLGGGGITDNFNGKQIATWEVLNTSPPKYIPVYADGKKGNPVEAADFGDAGNPRGTGRLGIPAFSSETRDSFIQQNLGGAKEGDANYERNLARAQSMWDAYSQDAIKAFQGVGASLAGEASRGGIDRRVSEAPRDPFVIGAAMDTRRNVLGLVARPGDIRADIRAQIGQPGRIGIGPRDSQGRSALSPSWGGVSDHRSDRNVRQAWGGGEVKNLDETGSPPTDKSGFTPAYHPPPDEVARVRAELDRQFPEDKFEAGRVRFEKSMAQNALRWHEFASNYLKADREMFDARQQARLRTLDKMGEGLQQRIEAIRGRYKGTPGYDSELFDGLSAQVQSSRDLGGVLSDSIPAYSGAMSRYINRSSKLAADRTNDAVSALGDGPYSQAFPLVARGGSAVGKVNSRPGAGRRIGNRASRRGSGL